MDIIVPIKQVPETGNVKIDEEKGTMVREGVESIVNPLDLYAIELALQLKESYGGKITVISMGPLNAEKALREAMAMGCDEGVLISDRAFAGSDTWATSYTLAQTIKKLGHFDMVITGVRATDGDTAQVGPGISAFLDLPLSTYTSSIKEITENTIVVERLLETGYETLKLPLPCLLTVIREIGYPRLPTLRGKQRARSREISIFGPKDIDADSSLIGINGSPVKVVKITRPRVARNGRIIDVGKAGINQAISELIEFLVNKNLV
ncbi:electron transfer flavoprotein subunit beta/FixA family protein [Candidatus Poribacteria bacterium]|nr:electron transfer flavoprotein subunit beta/FixA family protein [Candidatus Poribacteria bacterium]